MFDPHDDYSPAQYPSEGPAIALARQFDRISTEHSDQEYTWAEIEQIIRQHGGYLDPFSGEHLDLSIDAQHRAEAAALALRTLTDPASVDLAVYLTIDPRGQTHISYGDATVRMLAYVAQRAHQLTFHVSELPAELVREPYWDGEEITTLGFDELVFADRQDQQCLRAELHIRTLD